MLVRGSGSSGLQCLIDEGWSCMLRSGSPKLHVMNALRWFHVHFGSTQQNKLVMKPRQQKKAPLGPRHNEEAWILIWLVWSDWNHIKFLSIEGLKAACFSSELHSPEWNTGTAGLLAFLDANQLETALHLANLRESGCLEGNLRWKPYQWQTTRLPCVDATRAVLCTWTTWTKGNVCSRPGQPPRHCSIYILKPAQAASWSFEGQQESTTGPRTASQEGQEWQWLCWHHTVGASLVEVDSKQGVSQPGSCQQAVPIWSTLHSPTTLITLVSVHAKILGEGRAVPHVWRVLASARNWALHHVNTIARMYTTCHCKKLYVVHWCSLLCLAAMGSQPGLRGVSSASASFKAGVYPCHVYSTNYLSDLSGKCLEADVFLFCVYKSNLILLWVWYREVVCMSYMQCTMASNVSLSPTLFDTCRTCKLFYAVGSDITSLN